MTEARVNRAGGEGRDRVVSDCGEDRGQRRHDDVVGGGVVMRRFQTEATVGETQPTTPLSLTCWWLCSVADTTPSRRSPSTKEGSSLVLCHHVPCGHITVNGVDRWRVEPCDLSSRRSDDSGSSQPSVSRVPMTGTPDVAHSSTSTIPLSQPHPPHLVSTAPSPLLPPPLPLMLLPSLSPISVPASSTLSTLPAPSPS